MSAVLRRQWKRQAYPVEFGEGEDVERFTLRSMTYGEIEEADKLPGIERRFFQVACAMLDAGGKPELPREDGEVAEAFAARAMEFMRDVPSDTIIALAEAAANLRRESSVKAKAKN